MHEQTHIGILILIFISSSLFLGCLIRHVLKKSNIPYTVALLAIGLLTGFLGHFLASEHPTSTLVQINKMIGGIDPKLVLFIFLPVLIFESAFSLDVHTFKKLFAPISILAVPTLIICIILTAILMKFAFPWNWTWPICLMFSALISATDPVAVVALLKEISSSKQLEILIEGESLLNDGTAIVFFSIFYILAANTSLSFSLPNVALEFIIVVCSGMLVGILSGLVTVFWWGRVFNDPMIEISLSIIAAFSSFLIAEHIFHVSGVVAVVACAIVLSSYGNTKVSPEVSEFLHRFWSMMSFIAETVIFLIVGIVIGHRVEFDNLELWGMLGILYISIILIRAVAIIIFYPVLKRLNTEFNQSKAIVLTWGGLRGVVGLTLALAVIQDHRISAQLGDQILFLTAGIVILTIVINGSTMLTVIKWLGLDKLPIATFLTVRRAKLKIEESLRQYSPELKQHKILQEADWSKVEAIAGIDDKINIADLRDEGAALLQVEESDLVRACKIRILHAERKHYWTQLNNGMLGNTATRLLVKAVEQHFDDNPTISPRPDLVKHWKMPKILIPLSNNPILKKFILHYSFNRLSIGYEIAKGFLYAQDEIQKQLPAITPDIETKDKIIKDILTNKEMTYAHIQNMRKMFPQILTHVETYAATRSMLYKKRSLIKGLVASGLLDETETKKMISHVEDKIQNLNKQAHDLMSMINTN